MSDRIVKITVYSSNKNERGYYEVGEFTGYRFLPVQIPSDYADADDLVMTLCRGDGIDGDTILGMAQFDNLICQISGESRKNNFIVYEGSTQYEIQGRERLNLMAKDDTATYAFANGQFYRWNLMDKSQIDDAFLNYLSEDERDELTVALLNGER